MNQFLKVSGLVLATSLIAAACGPKRVPGPGPELKGLVETTYALRYVDIVKGTGVRAEVGRKVSVHYTGWLANGKKFDSSFDRGQPIEFILGTGRVIPGWDSGLDGMQVGGKRRLLIPYQLAYGRRDMGEIPPKSDLTFDVELVAVDSVSGAGR